MERFTGSLKRIIGNTAFEARYMFGREYSNFELLDFSDPYWASQFTPESFEMAREQLSGGIRQVVDIGAGRNPLRGLIFLDALHITCVDPAYRWYEDRPKDIFAPTPFPYGVFGGVGEKANFVHDLKLACKDLIMPQRIEGEAVITIVGKRQNQNRIFELVPMDAVAWMDTQMPLSVPNFVVWRTFPSAEVWGKIISTLKVGGVLITTGYGKAEDKEDYKEIKCGVNIDNSALPLNGNSKALGLERLAVLGGFIYRKTEHLHADFVTFGIKNDS